nr:substrate-binding domain-containing protein [uncultured Carboxylicivirga sp.]
MKIQIILAAFLIFLCSCSKNENYKIGFLYSSDVTKRFVIEGNYFKERASELGAEVIIDNGNGNEAVQYDKALEMFDSDIDALVLIAINANTAASIVREGQNRGVKVVAYNRIIFNCEPDLFISGDTKQLGKLMVNEVLKKRKDGKVIIFGGDKYDRNAIGLQNSIDEEIKPYIESGAFEILYQTYIEEWSDKNAEYEMKQFISLSNEKPDIVFAGFDGMADAVIKVLEENDMMDGVLITGQDAEITGVKNIIAGKQLMTAYHPLKLNAYTAAELTIDMLNGKNIDKEKLSYTFNGSIEVPTIKIPSVAITKENIDKELIETGVYTKQEVYN